MFGFGRKLSMVAPGDICVLPTIHSNQAWRVLRQRNIEQEKLHPVSKVLRPECVRSPKYTVIQNVATGRIRTVYRSDSVGVSAGPTHKLFGLLTFFI